MEQNNIETLEPVEVEEKVFNDKPELKEYEKLLIEEANRCDYEKAVSLIKYGCFEQKKENEVDFSDYEAIPTKKKFKGLYDLYRNVKTMELVFICPLVENNKGDVDENKAMAPYAYDMIIVEAMDDETYQMVCKAAKNNISNKVKVLYFASFICYFVFIGLTLINLVNMLILTADSNFQSILATVFDYCGVYFLGILLATPLLVLISIKYRKYKEQ